MDDLRELTTYAAGMSAALRVLGPTPPDQVLAMLRGLRLSADEAVEVIAFGLTEGILAQDEAGWLVSGEAR